MNYHYGLAVTLSLISLDACLPQDNDRREDLVYYDHATWTIEHLRRRYYYLSD
jgi:hypothetical protein